MNRPQTDRRFIDHFVKTAFSSRANRIGMILLAGSMLTAGTVSLIRRVSAVTTVAPSTVLVSAINGSATTAGSASAGLSSPGGFKSRQAISRDGRYIVFRSASTNLAPNDGNGTDDIFVRDLQTNATNLVSVTPAGNSGNSFSGSPVISGNGSVVVFSSQATDLIMTPDPCGGGVFARNLQTNTTQRVNINGTGGCASGAFGGFSLSFDGRYLAFAASVGNLDPNVTGIVSPDVYVRDLITGITTMVNANVAGTQSGNAAAGSPSMSDDGKFVAFESTASNLTTTAKTNNSSNADVYIRDLTTKKTAMVSVNSAGSADGNNASNVPVISGDGQAVVFRSDAGDLVANDTNNHTDLFARRIVTSTASQLTLGPTSFVSINSAGTNGGNGDSGNDYGISADGRYVAFQSSAGDLVTIDSNGQIDVFRRDLQANTTSLVSVRSDGLASSGSGGSAPFISADGIFVAFTSTGADLVAAHPNGNQDIFVRNFYTGITTLASMKSDNSTSGNTGTAIFSASKNGNTVAFNSGANDLVSPGISGVNVYARTNLNPQVPAAIALTFDGKLRDRVGQGDAAIVADGQPDGTFTVQLQSGTTTRQVVSLDINRGDGNEWDTVPSVNSVAGAARSLDGALLNNASGAVNFTIADGESLKLFASDNGDLFVGGKTFTVLIGFGDGTSATADVALPSPSPSPSPSPALTLSFDGLLGDKVKGGDGAAGFGADGALDGTFGMSLPQGDGSKFITKLELCQASVPCAQAAGVNRWDTVPNNQVWVIGIVNPTLGDSLDNNADGSAFHLPHAYKLFVPNANPSAFVQGNTFTLSVTFTDNTTMSASTTISQTPTSDLGIANLAVVPNPVPEGEATTFQVSLKNQSTSSLSTGVVLTHQLAQYEFFDGYGASGSDPTANATCTSNRITITCTISNILPGGDVQVALKLRFQKAQASGAGHAVFNVTSNQSDVNLVNNSANITATVTAPSAPSNDNIIGAVQLVGVRSTLDQQINLGATYQSNLCNAVNCNIAEPQHAQKPGGKSVWFYWQAPDNGDTLMFTNLNSFDTLLAVYAVTEDGRGLTDVAANDDADNNVSRSEVHFFAHKDNTYLIAVDGYNGATGSFALGWDLSVMQPVLAQAQVTGMCSGEKTGAGGKPDCDPVAHPTDAAVLCTADSASLPACVESVDNNGFRLLTVKGVNFTTDSQVVIKSKPLTGFTLAGTPINGQTDFINSHTLLAHIPPLPYLSAEDLLATQVVTKLASGGTRPDDELPPGNYSVAQNIGLINVILLKNAIIQPNHNGVVCGNLALFGLNKIGEETCIDMFNDGSGPVTINPTWFAINAFCQANTSTTEARSQCIGGGSGPERLAQLMHDGFSINPNTPLGQPLTGTMTITQKFNLPDKAAADALIATGGGNLIATGGGNLIATGGGNLVASGGGNLIATGGGNLIATGGGNLIATGGGNLIATGGGNLIATGGGNFISHNGSAIARLSDLFSNQGSTPNNPSTGTAISGDLRNGSKGWFEVKSSGGQAPAFTFTENLDGTVTGTITMTFDNTSSPRIGDLQGIVFTAVANPAVIQFAANNISVNEGAGHATVAINRTGDTTTTVTVSYATSNGTATEQSDYTPVYGSLTFAPGEITKNVVIPLIDNNYGAPDVAAQRGFSLTIGNAVGGVMQTPNVATITINNNDSSTAASNPLENSDARFFVRQHYLDFLSREPDQSGWDFWSNNISSCGVNTGCLQTKRADTSAAYFLSIEFQQTGFLVHRLYNAALNRTSGLPRYVEFVRDTQQIGRGVVVGQGNWEALLESNKQAFLSDFVNRREFLNLYPISLGPTDFVDAIYAHAGITPSAAERQAGIDEFSLSPDARAHVLRRVAESAALSNRESNRAFVLMQYFGYLRRNPDDAPDGNLDGFNFWLTKLNSFSGDFRRADMVKAFITSGEYRQRFGKN